MVDRIVRETTPGISDEPCQGLRLNPVDGDHHNRSVRPTPVGLEMASATRRRNHADSVEGMDES
ncbi:hypothetical protein [Microbacterium maritypicum]